MKCNRATGKQFIWIHVPSPDSITAIKCIFRGLAFFQDAACVDLIS